MTNGQALNAYAYVYNDPINLVDPSGHFAVKDGVGWLAHKGLDFLSWWYDVPEGCECSADPYNSIINFPLGSPSLGGQPYPISPGVLANSGYQLWWAYKSTPATRVATKTVERLSVSLVRVSNKVPQIIVDRLWPFAPTSVSRPGLSWNWRVTGQSTGSYTFIPSGKYRTGLFTRTTINRGPVTIRPGLTGFVGSIAGAGLIDALWQTLIDLGNKCLSLNQRFWRMFTAMGLGIVAGAVGTAIFTGLVAATLPGLIAAGAGFAVSAYVGYQLNRYVKEPYFATNPRRYGY